MIIVRVNYSTTQLLAYWAVVAPPENEPAARVRVRPISLWRERFLSARPVDPERIRHVEAHEIPDAILRAAVASMLRDDYAPSK